VANASTTKQELLTEAADLGIDIEQLGTDGKPATNQQIADAINARADQDPATVETACPNCGYEFDTEPAKPVTCEVCGHRYNPAAPRG
jgi:rubredoxin